MKKLLAYVLSLVLVIFIFPTAALATESRRIDTVSVTEINGVRTVKSSDHINEYTVINDTNNHTMTVAFKNIQTGEVTSSSMSTSSAVGLSSYILPFAMNIGESTSNGFEYSITTGTKNEWYLVRPMMESEGDGRYYFKCWENKSNSDYLEIFRTNVDDLSLKETELITEGGAAAFADFVTGIALGINVLSGGTLTIGYIAAVVVAAGLTGNAAVLAEAVGDLCNSCLLAIENVWNKTDNRHF